MDRLSTALFDAAVDLNPHQIEAAVFALANLISKGVILVDEVGLGKTIEAGIVLCQYWAERRRRLVVMCPASIRKQWALELSEKFNLPSVVLDARAWNEAKRDGRDPLAPKAVVVVSLQFVHRTTPDGRKTLVIWRTRPGGETPEGVEQDNLVLDTWFEKQGYSSKDSEFDLIYVNGGNNLENLKAPDDTWKVRMIEEDFHRLMFDVERV